MAQEPLVLDLSAGPTSTGLTLRVEDAESSARKAGIGSVRGYRPAKDLGDGLWYAYFLVESPTWVEGGQPCCDVLITLAADTPGSVFAEYDSADTTFRGAGDPGVWKPSAESRWSGNGSREVLRIILPRPFFGKRCNGADFRLVFRGAAPVIAAVRLEDSILSLVRWQSWDRAATGQEPVVAGATVVDFGAKGDGRTPGDQAFRDALLAVSAAGGGMVYVPPGRYLLERPLTIPAGAGLQGSWRSPDDGPVTGALLILKPPAGMESAFFTLGESTSLRDLTLWYPDQDPVRPKPCSWTIQQVGGHHATMENLTLVNSWKGILIGPGNNELHTLRNVWMTALDTGVEIDFTTDIGRMENVTIDPAIWSGSGLPGAPAKFGAHWNYAREKATGIRIYRSDWEYGSFIRVRDCSVGIEFLEGPNGLGNGQIFGLEIVGAKTALKVGDVLPEGYIISQGRLEAKDVALETGTGFSGSLMLRDMAIEAPLAVSLNGSASGSVQIRSGSIKGDIRQGPPSLSIAAVSGVTEDSVRRSGPSGPCIVSTGKEGSIGEPPSVASGAMARHGPSSSAFIVLEPSGSADESPAIQKALDGLGARGGTVFLPPGQWRLASPLIVPSGAELRGSMDVPRHTLMPGTVLAVEFDRGNEGGSPAITLRPGSGVRGLTFRHPGQVFRAPEEYPPAIRSAGSGTWMLDLNTTSPWWFLDLSTTRSDGAYVDSVQGAPLRLGITVGAGSRNVVIRNLQFNPHYAVRSGFPETNKSGDGMGQRMVRVDLLEPIVLGDARDVLLFQCFVFGSKSGLTLRPEKGRGPTGMAVGQGTDGSPVALTVEGTGPGGFSLINSLLVSMTEKSRAYIQQCGASTVRLWGTSCWGRPNRSVDVSGGWLGMELSRFVTYGAFRCEGATTVIDQSVIGSDSQETRPSSEGTGSVDLRRSILAMSWEGSGDGPGKENRAVMIAPPADARSVSVAASSDGFPVRNGLAFRAEDPESRVAMARRDGRWGWLSSMPLDTGRDWYMYLTVGHEPFRNAGSGKVVVSITYRDGGGGEARLVYDSSDGRPQIPGGVPGVWKRAGTFRLGGSPGWRTWTAELPDPRFSGRCNGADLRLEILDTTEPPIITEVIIMKE